MQASGLLLFLVPTLMPGWMPSREPKVTCLTHTSLLRVLSVSH